MTKTISSKVLNSKFIGRLLIYKWYQNSKLVQFELFIHNNYSPVIKTHNQSP
jgi:hypothetical protein